MLIRASNYTKKDIVNGSPWAIIIFIENYLTKQKIYLDFIDSMDYTYCTVCLLGRRSRDSKKDRWLVLFGRIVQRKPLEKQGVSMMKNKGLVLSGLFCLVVLFLSGCEVTIPDLVGMHETDAGAALENVGLSAGTVSYAEHEEIPQDHIVSHVPEAGTKVKKGSSVDLLVSSGKAALPTIPGLLGQGLLEAQEALVAAGFAVGDVTEECNDSVAAGTIISMVPPPDTQAESGTVVALAVSSGPCPLEAIPVPDLAGMDGIEAEAAITAADLTMGDVTEECSDTVDEGKVIRQEPAAIAMVMPGSAVSFVLSTGSCPPDYVTVPDVNGQSSSAAEAAVVGAGLAFGAVTQECSNTVPSGNVIRQNPAAGAQVEPGSEVSVVLSSGPCLPALVKVPNVIGKSQSAANTSIKNVGLAVGTVTQECSDTVSKGNVIRQNPAAGTDVPRDSKVALVVSNGGCIPAPPPTIAVPNVVGMMQSAAESAITAAGFTIGVVFEEWSTTVPDGAVIRQNPEGGTRLKPGSAISLVVSSGTETNIAIEIIDENGGAVELDQAILTIPPESLKEPLQIFLERNRNGAQIELRENEQPISEIYTIGHNGGFSLPAAGGTFGLTLSLDISDLQKNQISRDFIYLKVVTEDGHYRILGNVLENEIQVNLFVLPERSDLQVVFNPNIRRVISEIDDEKILTTNSPWQTTRWYCYYDASLSKLRQAVADIRGMVLTSVTDAIVDEVVMERVANNARDAAKYFQNLGLREANLQIIESDSLNFMVINVDTYPGIGPHYRNNPDNFGQLNLDADFLRDSFYPIYNTVLDVISHEMFHACFNGYELNITSNTYAGSLGFNEGLATVMGATIDNDYISVRPISSYSSQHRLNNSIGSPSLPYDNNDWFAYIGKRFDNGSLLYVGGHGTDDTGSSNGLLEQMRIEVDTQTFSTANRALNAFRNAMQISFSTQFGLDLSEIYWDYARNRSYEHNDESRLRSDDWNIARYSLDTSVFDMAYIYNYTFSSDNESIRVSYQDENMLKDIPPLSTRAMVFTANGFVSDLALTFDTSQWIFDSLGNSMLVKIYKEGENGVELQSDRDTVYLRNFGDATTKSPFGTAIVLLSNVSLDKTYSVDMTASTTPALESTGAIMGRVTEAGTDSPIGEVTVIVRKQGWIWTGDVLNTATTDDNGQFLVEHLPSGNVELTFTKDGYVTTFQRATVVENACIQINATLIVVDTGVPTGNASGRVIDAVTGSGISGVNLVLRAGILQLSDTSGDVITTTTTNAYGDYSFTNIAAGTYTVFANRIGYAADVFYIFIVGGTTRTGQNGDMSPNVAEGEIRIILTWGENPHDLDSHLTGPSYSGEGRFHLYYPYAETYDGSPESGHISLDLDDVSSYGPETTTIYARFRGTYRFSVHDYTNRGSSTSVTMSNSSAKVRVVSESGTQEFYITPNTPATLWTVFEIDGETGVLTAKNEYSFESSPSSVSKGLIWHYGLGSEAPSVVTDLLPKQ